MAPQNVFAFHRSVLFVMIFVWTLGSAACGLLDDMTAFTLDTDWYSFTVDSANFGLTIPTGSKIPTLPCSAGDTLCGTESTFVKCGTDTVSCQFQCNAKGACEVVIGVENAVSVNLAKQIQSNTQAEALKKASLSKLFYETEVNTLTFDTPKIEVYLGDEKATRVSDAGVVPFATMPKIPKTTLAKGLVEDLADGGNDALAEYVKNYQKSFKFLFRSSYPLSGGDELPQGRITVKLKAYIEIEPL